MGLVPHRLRPDFASVRALLRVAWPLILTNSFSALLITIDRVFLSQFHPDTLSASLAASLVFWVPMSFFLGAVGYASTFVAQYVGAGQTRRVGAVIWQSLYLALFGGLAFIPLIPLIEPLLTLGGHNPTLVALETAFLHCLCYSALPTLVVAATTSFFTGRGESRLVLLIEGVGLLVNGILAYLLIFGIGGFPTLGIVGAGIATVAGTTCSALLGLFLLFQRRYRIDYDTTRAWRWDSKLVVRMLRFGGPNGLLLALDTLSWTLFLWVIGLLGEVEFAATSIAWTLNLLVYFPGTGMAQGVGVLVGQHLGENRPDRAERATWTGLWLNLAFTLPVGLVYLLLPDFLAELFRSRGLEMDLWVPVRDLVPMLLRFVVVYCLFDAMNLVFSFALRGAGDTRFVTLINVCLAWPLMVVPTWASWYFGLGLYWIWFSATLYIVILGLVFLVRFRGGAWRTMRVIETTALPLATHAPQDSQPDVQIATKTTSVLGAG